MNYLELINNIWELREQGIISVHEHDLYCYLVHKCNKLGWKNPFNQSTEIICAVLGINRNALTNRRNKLSQLGLIKFKDGITKKKPAEYVLCNPMCNLKDTQVNTQCDTLHDTEHNTQCDTLPNTYTLNKTKQNENKTKLNNNPLPLNSEDSNLEIEKEKKEKSSAKKEKIDLKFHFESEEFKKKWELLISMPKWKKKINHSLQLALDQLGRYDEEFAIKQMESAIAGNWQGVVFSNTDEEFSKWKKQKSNGSSQISTTRHTGEKRASNISNSGVSDSYKQSILKRLHNSQCTDDVQGD